MFLNTEIRNEEMEKEKYLENLLIKIKYTKLIII